MFRLRVARHFHRNRTRPIRFSRPHLSIAAFVLLCFGQCWGTDEIDFTNRESLEASPSDNGTITLQWSNPEKLNVRIEQAPESEFTSSLIRYEGKGKSTVLSGLAEGSHFFRIGESDGTSWSSPLEAKVEFFPREQLWLLLSLGGVVVLMTAGAIIVGYFSTRKGDES
ncbi:MAG: hypothetical protein P1U58_19810 [Verrucomicrobiales bacterium]|nr:hypothetical protein [Verrucomicrobiales bacterium]